MRNDSCPFLDNAGAGKCLYADWEICPYWFKGCPFPHPTPKIKVVVKKPDCAPEVQEIENDWKEFKRLIGGGTLQCVTIGAGIMMYCDDEGKLEHKQLPYNFSLGIWDFVVGDVVFFGNDGGEAEQSLTDDQIEYLQYMLHYNHVAILRCEQDLQFVLKNKRLIDERRKGV